MISLSKWANQDESHSSGRELLVGKANPKQWSVASGQWPVNPEGAASGKWPRVAAGKANPSAASRRKRGDWHQKRRQTKPIRNQRKAHCRLRLNRLCPSLRVENEAKARRQWRVASGHWSVASECEAGETAVIEDRQDRHQFFFGH